MEVWLCSSCVLVSVPSHQETCSSAEIQNNYRIGYALWSKNYWLMFIVAKKPHSVYYWLYICRTYCNFWLHIFRMLLHDRVVKPWGYGTVGLIRGISCEHSRLAGSCRRAGLPMGNVVSSVASVYINRASLLQMRSDSGFSKWARQSNEARVIDLRVNSRFFNSKLEKALLINCLMEVVVDYVGEGTF